MKKFFPLLFIGFLLLVSCGTDNVQLPADPSVQLMIDNDIIDDYFFDRGYQSSQIDSTELGVFYVIVDNGSGEVIDESDLVEFNYIGRLANDTIFNTSIKAIGDSIRMQMIMDSVGAEDATIYQNFILQFSEDRQYSPFRITYTQSGWSTEGLIVRGFSDGLSASFNGLREGGHAVFAMPSALGYGASPDRPILIPLNAVLVFELFPTKVLKQGS